MRWGLKIASKLRDFLDIQLNVALKQKYCFFLSLFLILGLNWILFVRYAYLCNWLHIECEFACSIISFTRNRNTKFIKDLYFCTFSFYSSSILEFYKFINISKFLFIIKQYTNNKCEIAHHKYGTVSPKKWKAINTKGGFGIKCTNINHLFELVVSKNFWQW